MRHKINFLSYRAEKEEKGLGLEKEDEEEEDDAEVVVIGDELHSQSGYCQLINVDYR